MALDQRVVVLVGGVGGAKLALGLQQIISPDNLTIIVNTGDDFWHYGLRICPDLDTVMYTLSGRVDRSKGWGVADDTITALEMLRTYGEDPWFRLGDKDIATHLLRTHLYHEGHTLTQICQRLAQGMGIRARVLPMCNEEVATIVETQDLGALGFQTYFVRHRWQPIVTGLRYEGASQAQLTPEVREALETADVLLMGPSNPWLSIAPILAIPAMREALLARDIPRVAVTPIVQGKAIKGPAAKLMGELGYEVSAQTVATYYAEIINGFVYDQRDRVFNSHHLKTVSFDTMMETDADKSRLAQEILDWIEVWGHV